MLVPVILAGGLGSRLWPLSRETHPKQFLPLIKGQSLFQETLARLAHIPATRAPIVIGNEQHQFLIAQQIRQSSQPNCQVILEPCFKSTAPAVALAAVQALAHQDEDVLLLVLCADHFLADMAGFAQTVKEAVHHAQSGNLVSFGVVPTQPETGYGYIQKGNAIANTQGFQIARFIEKPKLAKALEYVESREYWWNSGMFLFSAGAYLQELLLHSPQIYHAAKAALSHTKSVEGFIRPDLKEFEKSPVDSIDYAVMENTSKGVVVPLCSPWSDVGSWDALADLLPKDDKNNVCVGDVVIQETENCLIHADQRLVVTMGVRDLVVVETSDTVLVMNKSNAQAIKPLFNQLRVSGRKETLFPKRVARPWGAFESIDNGERFQVKRITVAIGQRLSLQRHHHRSEHWVVVKGTARVTRGDEVFLLSENQSTYIPIGVDHRLENVGKIPLEIIEVQSGAYLGEDDILRLEDQYGRLQEEASMTKEKDFV